MFSRLFNSKPEARKIVISQQGTSWHCCYKSDHGGSGYADGSYLTCPIDGSPTLAGHSFTIGDGSAQLVAGGIQFSFLVPADVGEYFGFNFWGNVRRSPINLLLETLDSDNPVNRRWRLIASKDSIQMLTGGNQVFDIELAISALGTHTQAPAVLRATFTGDASFHAVDVKFGWWPTQSKSKPGS